MPKAYLYVSSLANVKIEFTLYVFSKTKFRAARKCNEMHLSLQGWTGVGKNYVSSIIGEHIRTKRRTVHEYIIPLHFPHNAGDHSYVQLLQDWVLGNLSFCAINLVVIDEVEKATDNLRLGIENLLEKFDEMQLNSTRVIVLLLSSEGGIHINNLVYSHISGGGHRESLSSANVLEALKDKDAIEWFLSLRSRGLIDDIVPFLPLEKRHVARCIEQDIEHKHSTCANPHVVQEVMDELAFFPPNGPLFSTAGCRKVGTKVDLVVDSFESRHSYYTATSHEKQ